MKEKQVHHREAARRQHRALGLYAMLYCWVRGLDGVAIERRTLERFLGLDRFKGSRVGWLKEDLKTLFPENHIAKFDKVDKLACIYLCRKPFMHVYPKNVLKPRERVKRFPSTGPHFGVLDVWSEPLPDDAADQDLSALTVFVQTKKNKDERLLTAYLALLASGQIGAAQVPGVKPKKAETSSKTA